MNVMITNFRGIRLFLQYYIQVYRVWNCLFWAHDNKASTVVTFIVNFYGQTELAYRTCP